MVSPLLAWRTVRHLSWRQIRHQVRHRFAPAPVPARGLPMRWSHPADRAAIAPRGGRPAYDGAGAFRFNNETRAFAGDWNDPAARKLWLYNLHYMGWLHALPAPEAERWMRDWIAANLPARGGNGWEPYPASLRLVNWCLHYAASGREPDAGILGSLGLQAASVLARLEFHLDGNHLLENLFALCMAGFHFDPDDAVCRAARARIRSLLEAEMAVQYLADGGHFELSPMYHAILLERMLDILACWPAGADPYPGLRPVLESRARAALEWLAVMTVSGRFALFNDACYDAAPESRDLLAYGARLLGVRPTPPSALAVLEPSGYYRAESGPFTVIFDGGPLGPDRQMGHAQGDMLSLCAWFEGRPLLVHPGNYEYVPGPMRDYCRATSSHNTAAPEGAEQAEWWGSHRVARRARPAGSSAAADGGRALLKAAHDGYPGFPGRPRHAREIEVGAGAIVIRDRLEGAPGRTRRAWFHFHPDWRLERADGGVEIRAGDRRLFLESDRPLEIGEGWHCPEFGLRERTQIAVAVFTETTCRCALTRR